MDGCDGLESGAGGGGRPPPPTFALLRGIIVHVFFVLWFQKLEQGIPIASFTPVKLSRASGLDTL